MRTGLRTAAAVGTAMIAAMDSSAYAAEIESGPWRFAVTTPIGEMPFNVDLTKSGDAWTAILINGPERIEAEVTEVAGDTLTIAFPSYNSSLSAKFDGALLAGAITLNRPMGALEIPFTARHGEVYRFSPAPVAATVDLTGTWSVTVTAADGKTQNRGIGEFAQNGETVDGSVIYVNADTRFLNGELSGDTLALSTFDGGYGTLWTGQVQPDGSLVGKSYGLSFGAVTEWRAVRDDTVMLPDPNTLTYLKDGYDKFEFSFPDLDGKPVSLADERFKDKVVIVTIAGTWCPTCHDEARFLAPFVTANRARGLEAVALQYEYSSEFDKAVAACRKFAHRYGVDYPMLIAGTADKSAASATLPMINAVLVYPTMIVIDRKGEVRRIHTSFPGPATGHRHEDFKREFTALVDELLAEGV